MENSIRDLIQKVSSKRENLFCFDCESVKSIDYISINNGIFLCKNCANVHKKFQSKISRLVKNNLYSLSFRELELLSKGGNKSLRDFITNEFPKLAYLTPEIMYKTNAMEYYRQKLNYAVNQGKYPVKPPENLAYKEVEKDSFFTDLSNEIKNSSFVKGLNNIFGKKEEKIPNQPSKKLNYYNDAKGTKGSSNPMFRNTPQKKTKFNDIRSTPASARTQPKSTNNTNQKSKYGQGSMNGGKPKINENKAASEKKEGIPGEPSGAMNVNQFGNTGHMIGFLNHNNVNSIII